MYAELLYIYAAHIVYIFRKSSRNDLKLTSNNERFARFIVRTDCFVVLFYCAGILTFFFTLLFILCANTFLFTTAVCSTNCVFIALDFISLSLSHSSIRTANLTEWYALYSTPPSILSSNVHHFILWPYHAYTVNNMI